MEVLTGRSSEHRPILLVMNKRDTNIWKRSKVFRYEASWHKEEGCEEVIKEAWEDTEGRRGSQKPISEQLEGCRGALLSWSKQFSKDRSKEVKEKSEALKRLEDEESSQNSAEIKKL